MGFVYVFTNPFILGVKIGSTERDPAKRADELSAVTGVPARFAVAYSVEVSDARSVESRVHEALASFRLSPDREFFSCPPSQAITIIEGLCGRAQPEPTTRLHPLSDAQRLAALGAPPHYDLARLRHQCHECGATFFIPY